jgi:type IV fimbrial biogenesis protein FimT
MMNIPPFFQLPRQDSGLTLIELMVTISILAILMVVAIPSFQSMIASSNLTTSTNDLSNTLAQARSNAIRLGGRVTVCKSSNGTQCATTGNWEQGWIVFNDPTRSGTTANVDADEVITFVAPAQRNGIVINGNLTYVSYAADGQTKQMSGAFQSGTLRVCNTNASLTNAKRARNLTLAGTGRIVVQAQANVAATCPAP